MSPLISPGETAPIAAVMDDEEIKLRIGKHLKKLRVDQGLTKTEFAERIRRSPRSISRFESGHDWMALDTAIAAARALGVSLDELTDHVVEDRAGQIRELGARVMRDARALGLSDEYAAMAREALQQLATKYADARATSSRPPSPTEPPHDAPKSPGRKGVVRRKSTRT